MSKVQSRWFIRQWPLLISVVCVGVSLMLVGLWFVPEPVQMVKAVTANEPEKRVLPFVPVADIPVLKPELIGGQATTSGNINQSLGQAFTATLSARSMYAIDVDSATPLLAKNPDSLEYPASTTKLVTALLVRQVFDLNNTIPIPLAENTQSPLLQLKLGEQLTVKDLLAALIILSRNDAATALADHYEGGSAAFVDAMNQLARALHVQHSNFANPDGLDLPQQQTTARDLSIIARKVIEDPVLSELVKTKELTILNTSGVPQAVHNTNALLGVEPGVIGLKTGTTEWAGEVLITLVERDNRRVLIVLMGSKNRYDETRAILSWIYNHYQWLSLAEAQQLVLNNAHN